MYAPGSFPPYLPEGCRTNYPTGQAQVMDGIAVGSYDAFNSLLADSECTRMTLQGHALPHFYHTRA